MTPCHTLQEIGTIRAIFFFTLSFLPRSKSELGRNLYSQGNGGSPGEMRIDELRGCLIPTQESSPVSIPSSCLLMCLEAIPRVQDLPEDFCAFCAWPGPTQLGWREAQGQTAQMLCCHGNYLTLVQARLLRSHKEGIGRPCWIIKPIPGPHGCSLSISLAFPLADPACVNEQAYAF